MTYTPSPLYQVFSDKANTTRCGKKKQCNDIKLNSFQQYLFSMCAPVPREAANRFNIFNDESAYTEAIKKSQSLQKKNLRTHEC